MKIDRFDTKNPTNAAISKGRASHEKSSMYDEKRWKFWTSQLLSWKSKGSHAPWLPPFQEIMGLLTIIIPENSIITPVEFPWCFSPKVWSFYEKWKNWWHEPCLDSVSMRVLDLESRWVLWKGREAGSCSLKLTSMRMQGHFLPKK